MSTPQKRIAFHTLGCKLNFSETATISRDFIRQGFKKVQYKDFADIYVLNTCSVTENANKEARKMIRKAKRLNPNSSIAIIGCYAQLKPKEIASIEGVDLVLGTKEKFNLLHYFDQIDLTKQARVIQSGIDHVNKFTPSFSSEERTRAFMKIQDGCDYSCSFCTIPLARGKSRSDTIENTILLANSIAETKAREIVLTGVNIGDYGKEGETFLDLIKQLELLSGVDRFRISSIEPNLLTDKIIEFCGTSKKFMPHFHVPLQSGSDKILSAMRRRYNSKLYEDRISKIKHTIPDACIGVDVIVGFPGETDEDFNDTYNFLNKLNISYLHVFTYSERPNTDAYQMGNVVPKNKKIDRSRMLHFLSEKKQRIFQNHFLGKKRQVLFESIKNGKLMGHTDNYINVKIDAGSELINTIHNVLINQNQGSFVNAVLEDLDVVG